MNEYKPLHKNSFILKDLGDEFLIYSSEHQELHVINPTARLIWDLCDGGHSVTDIEQEMRTHFSVPAQQDLPSEIRRTIDIFRDKGLLEN